MSWKEAQTAQYEYSDEEEYSDDDYEPINISSWGNQTITQEGTTEIDVSMDGWNSLIDPSVKLKAGGIGSGQLHRKGANFKPLDEQHIINQRLGKPIPKALGGGKKRGGKKPKGPPPPARRPPPPSSLKPSSLKPSSLKPSSLKPPSSSAYRSREIVAGQSPWGSAELASTPFWEQPNSATGSNASKYATPAPVTRPPPQQYQQPPQQQYQQPPPPPQQQYQQPPSAPTRQPEPPTNLPSTRLGTSASKYATPETQQYQQYSQPIQPHTIYHKLDVPCLNFNIEMAPGITAKLSVYEDDDPVAVVDKFEKDHAVTMSELHKRRFAEKVAMLLAEYKTK